ncbi:GAL10 [[Candida] subhashii]|uniref:GAL10 n=2 Tax=Debaryomycetaceae TaxID=766764 RepID=A0A8J5QET6_9ASCO|nr:GAL10 [[Candida] subhashii]KAG7660420.1 GAL10 [[Candida] subhashii]
MSDEYILVTGGAGYIGSHTVIELINNGYKVVILDNLSNSSYDAVARIEFIVKQPVPFVNADLRKPEELNQVFQQYKIAGVIHFAALKAVGESTKIPLEYYYNNVNGTVNLLAACKANGVKSLVFSSSATVYGDVTRFGDNSMIPIPEHCPRDPTNPYGRTKAVIETVLKDVYESQPDSWKFAVLRYFNPIGAHPSGLLGEDPLGVPNNLLPYLAQVAVGRREKLSVFGDDYNSHDGTPIRDYIHVVDLAKGHIAALAYLKKLNDQGLYREWNLGTGKGSTVFDVYNAFCKAVGKELPYEVVARRDGDVLDLTAVPTRANEELGWKAELTIDDACRDLWKWTTENPYGFNVANYSWKTFESDGNLANRLHTFKNGNLTVALANRGALIQDIVFNGEHLVKAYDNGDDFKLASNPYFGTTVGRYANRIAEGKFELNGKKYQLTTNEGPNNLHGGFNGFDKQNLLGPVVKFKDGAFTVEFLIVDKDGNDGFPGELETIVKYIIDDSSLEFQYEAKLLSGEATIVNMTNHTYFNITGDETTDGTEVKLASDIMMEVDAKSLLPTGNFIKNEKVTVGKPIVMDKDAFFDYCFIGDEAGCGIDTRSLPLKAHFECVHPKTTTKLTVSSTEPAFQFYTGDGVNTKGFGKRSGFCLEPSRFVNAINHKEWADQVILKKGEVYGTTIKYSFAKKD